MRYGVLVAMVLSAACGAGRVGGGGSSSGGTGGERDAGPLYPTLSSIQAHVFTPTCSVSPCHNASDRAGNLNLAEGQSYAELVGIKAYELEPKVAPDGGFISQGSELKENLCDHNTTATATVPDLVVAGDPTDSYLMWKLTGTTSTGASIEETSDCGRMPKLVGVTVTQDQVDAIRAWIQAGAPND